MTFCVANGIEPGLAEPFLDPGREKVPRHAQLPIGRTRAPTLNNASPVEHVGNDRVPARKGVRSRKGDPEKVSGTDFLT